MAHSLFIRNNMMQQCEDLVEVDSISFEDSFPLGERYSGGGIGSNFDEELGFGDISVVGS
jgi:hypothetical protein